MELVPLAFDRQTFPLRQAFGAFLHLLIQRLQALDRLRHRLPIRKRAAKPPVVHVILGAALGGLRDSLLGLAFRTDEKYRAALRDHFANRPQGGIKHRHRLGQVDDMNPVSLPIDEFTHLGVPALGLMAKMNACLQ